jgi:hypothetical protein
MAFSQVVQRGGVAVHRVVPLRCLQHGSGRYTTFDEVRRLMRRRFFSRLAACSSRRLIGHSTAPQIAS